MPDWTKIWETFSKAAPLPLFVVAASSSICLFGSTHLLATLGLVEFRDRWRMWLGVATLVSTTYLVGYVFVWIQRKVARTLLRRTLLRSLRKRLSNLTRDEREYLRCYLDGDNRTHRFSMRDPVVAGLEAAGILWKPTQMLISNFNRNSGEIEFPCSYNMTDSAWDCLSDHPEFLSD